MSFLSFSTSYIKELFIYHSVIFLFSGMLQAYNELDTLKNKLEIVLYGFNDALLKNKSLHIKPYLKRLSMI